MIETFCPAIQIVKKFYTPAESHRLFQTLLHHHHWPDNHYSYAGRQFTLPRLQTWHADPGIVYSYSNNLLVTRPWTPLLAAIKRKVEDYLHFGFNSVLVNLYRNGEDYVGWHADDERELGDEPFIASVTFGAERVFAYRHKRNSASGKIPLAAGSLLVMQPEFQHQWRHSIPADPSIRQGRINLTFRYVLTATQQIP